MSESRPIKILALLSEPILNGDEVITRLDMKAKVERVRRQLERIDRAAVLRFVVAEPEAVFNALRDHGPFDVIHFEGHGGPGALAFEDGCAGTFPLDVDRLHKLLSPDGRVPAPVAFLSACHSGSMADALLAAGVSHVIAIDADESVLEVAARAFAAQFYPALLSGASVKQAFDFGCAGVFDDPIVQQACEYLAQGQSTVKELLMAEVRKFRLLPDDRPDRHQANPLAGAPRGSLDVIELPPSPETIGARPEFFVGREHDLHAVINSVMDHRMTTVVGMGGMGKSELCREVGRWFAARDRFRNGITFIPLGAYLRADEARAQIAAALRIDLQQAQTPIALARLMPRDALVILDELDSLIQDDRANTRVLIEALRDHAQSKILIASRYRTGVTGEQEYQLTHLSDDATRRLFLQLIDQPGREIKRTRRELDEILTFLDGFPRAIVLAAKQVTSPELHWLLEDLRASKEELLNDPTIPAEERRDSASVLITLNSMVKRLTALDAAAASFFPWLALFPAGVGEEGLRAIFGADARHIRTILDLALAEITPELRYYYLPAPVRSYAARRLPPDAIEQIGQRALAHYHDLANQYDDVIVKQGRDELGVALFALELPNFELFLDWGCDHETSDAAPPICYTARITGLFQNFFIYFDPGRTQIERYRRALGAAQRLGDRLAEANVLKAIGDVQNFRKEMDAALASYTEALKLFRAVGDRLGEANVLKAIGDVQNFRKEMDAALASYTEALKLFRAVGDRLGEANVLKAIGDVQNFRKEMDAALASYTEALKLFRAVGDRLGEANVLKAIGDVQNFRKEMDAALASYTEALKLFRAVGDRLGEANVLKAIGDVQNFRKEMDAALASYTEALKLFRAVGDRLGEANVLQAIGDVQNFRDERDAALASYTEALKLFRAVGARLGEANVLKAIGDVQNFRKEMDAALASYTEALKLFRAVGDRLGEANVLKAIGDVQNFRDERDAALASYTEALKLFRAVGARLGEANVLKAIGDVQNFRKEMDAALASYTEALKLFRAVGDRLGEANVLQAIGDVQNFRDERDAALASYTEALKLFRAVGARLGEANVLQAIGDVQNFRDERDAALASYTEALKLFRAVGDRLGEANVHLSLGRMALASGDEQHGVEYLEHAAKLYESIGAQSGSANVRIALAKHAASKNNFQSAIDYLQPAADFGKRIRHPLGDQMQAQIDEWRQRINESANQ